jgi:hypothetical protein
MEPDEDQDREPGPGAVQRIIRSYPLIFTIAVVITLGWAVVGYLWEPPFSQHWKERGPIGDAVAPLTALLTAAALFWSIHSIQMQREELRLQREELRAQREERKASREALQEQAAAQKQQVQAQQRMERAYLLLANTTQLASILNYFRQADAERDFKLRSKETSKIIGRLQMLAVKTEAALASIETETEMKR